MDFLLPTIIQFVKNKKKYILPLSCFGNWIGIFATSIGFLDIKTHEFQEMNITFGFGFSILILSIVTYIICMIIEPSKRLGIWFYSLLELVIVVFCIVWPASIAFYNFL